MLKNLRRILATVLIINILYANLQMATMGIISYAIDHTNVTNDAEENLQENEEEIKKLEISVSDFLKNNMIEQETEYEENLKINLDSEEIFKEVLIVDVSTIIDDGQEETETTDNQETTESTEEKEEDINVFYKNTVISKEQLLQVIGESGSLEIKYTVKESEEKETTGEEVIQTLEETQTEEATETTEEVLSNPVVINKDIEADQEGNITITYPENVISLELKITTEANKIENLNIKNTRTIEKVTDLSKVNELATKKQLVVKNEEELINEQVELATPILYTSTKAELGIDKAEISTSVENEVQFTITMLTENIKYDLYKNPYFVIELPSVVNQVDMDTPEILNNPGFVIDTENTKKGTLENGNKSIQIKLTGEQIEYAASNAENVQIVVKATITTEKLIPTTEASIKMYYQNENVKTYDGIGTQTIGEETVPCTFVSNTGIIVETKTILGEETISSFNETYKTATVKPDTYTELPITGTIVNNTGENLNNIKILGIISDKMGPISGLTNVYYTSNENATLDVTNTNNGWKTEYTQSAKKYLILVEEFAQAQKLSFTYNMYLTENIDVDTNYEQKYEIYDSNNELLKTSKINIYREAKQIETVENEKIKATITLDKSEDIQIGDTIEGKIVIENISGEDLNNVTLDITIPMVLNNVYSRLEIDEALTQLFFVNEKQEEPSQVTLNLAKDGKAVITIYGSIGSYLKPSENIKVDIKYDNTEINLSKNIKIVEPSNIETIITSNKLNTELKADEKIEYKITLKNSGKSNAIIDGKFISKMESMDIEEIIIENKTTGELNSMSGVSLLGEILGISINAGETVEITIKCIVKVVEQEITETVKAAFTGASIYDVTTDELTNKIVKEGEENPNPGDEETPGGEENPNPGDEETPGGEEENPNPDDEQKPSDDEIGENNTISGIAWVDKNQNGTKEPEEIVLKDIYVTLIDTKTSQEVEQTQTNNEGEYSFTNITDGSYIVIFAYNTNTFDITEYKVAGEEKATDSDVISTTQNNATIAKTEVIVLQNEATENINIGLVVKQKFDMLIKKQITKVTVNNDKGTDTYEYENTDMAKVEIEGEYFKGSMLLIEYTMTITNNGELKGYAKQITDEIPEGMKFSSELNTEWYEGTDGKLYSATLADKELVPGESTTLKLVLTKEMTDDKVTTTVNKANIEEVYNEYLIEDRDSDNNTSEATIIISIKTGSTRTYIWLITTVITIIGLGAFSTIKIINKDYEKKEGGE